MKGNITNSTSSNRRTGNLVQQKIAKQTVGSSEMGNSARVNQATGSGASVTRGRYAIESSAPADAQRIRTGNKIDPQPNYGK